MDVRLVKGKNNKITLAVWQGNRKHVACLRTVKSLIANMVTGVTKVSTSLCILGNGSIAPNRVSYIKCARYMPTSRSIASSRTMVTSLKSGISWVRRYDA